MTLRELYQSIGGDYEQALRVLRVEKLVDKHIRKLEGNSAFESLFSAAERMDGGQLFEAAHAIKGVCGNLGLVRLASAASEITEEFRPGNGRSLDDEEIRDKLEGIRNLYGRTIEGIHRYTESC